MNESASSFVVIKAGGSLLRQSGGLGWLKTWLASSEATSLASRRVLLLGGGPVVDGLRLIDSANPISVEGAHWAAIEMLDTLARLFAPSLPGFELTDSFDTLRQADAGSDRLFCPGQFLRETEPHLPGPTLPIGWETTSDSIAARLAGCLDGALVLLKSSPPGSFSEGDWRQAAENAYVDQAFPPLSKALSSIRIVTADLAN